MPLPWRMGFAIEIPQPAPMPQTAGIIDEEFRPAAVDRQRFRPEGLQLYAVRPALGGGVHDPQCAIEAGIVVGRQLGNDHRAMPATDRPAADFCLYVCHCRDDERTLRNRQRRPTASVRREAPATASGAIVRGWKAAPAPASPRRRRKSPLPRWTSGAVSPSPWQAEHGHNL